MARIKLDLPPVFKFSTELTVRITDINYGGHLGNDALLSLLHEARLRFLQSLGWSEMDCGGASIIMTDAAIVYRNEAFQGERLRIDVAVTDLQAMSCDIVYRVVNAGTAAEVARAKTGIAFFDYQARKVVPAPAAVRDAFSI
jgi:acyl-CoA thioester hydrolase